jgi:hypothetical protein
LLLAAPVGLIDRTGVKCLIVFKRGWEQRLCGGCKIHPGWASQGKKSQKNGKGYQLRESTVPYGDHFEVENEDIGLQNAYLWNDYPVILER